MSGQWLLLTQVELYMKSRKQGHTQTTSAAKAGISTRSGREIEKGRRIDPKGVSRTWRTRIDPFGSVWSTELVPMLCANPLLSALTLLEYLQSRDGDNNTYPDNLLRTLQRRVKRWNQEDGPAKEVIFRQEHIPGQMGLSDFTHLKGVSVTIRGELLKHLLYQFRVIFSGWSYLQVILGGESYAALSEGLQNALWRLGGAPHEHRTDSLSAAFKNLSSETKADQTTQYEQLCTQYGMTATRNNLGVSHENGGIESPHGHLKWRIKQAFLIRGSYDFDSIEAYQDWIERVTDQHNRRNAKSVDIEKAALKCLPTYKSADYTTLPVKVSSSSTIQVRTSLYTVPSRLVAATLQVHLYHDRLRCYLGGTLVAEMNRVYGEGAKRRAKNIDYRHVIESLAKKPMAFYHSQLRDALLPSAQYQQIWQSLNASLSAREASRLMVGILHISAQADCEVELGDDVLSHLLLSQVPELSQLRERWMGLKGTQIPVVNVKQHALNFFFHFSHGEKTC